MTLQNLLFFVSLYAMLAMSLNIPLGYTGVISLAQAAYYGLGAYTAALLSGAMSAAGTTIPFFPDFLLCALAAAMVAGVFATVTGAFLLRLRGDHFVMVTLAFGEFVRSILASSSFTGGNLGVRGIPSIDIAGHVVSHGWPAVALAAVAALGTYWLCGRIERSRFGLSLRAVRDDDVVAHVTGHWPNWVRLRALVVGAAIAGLAGALVAPYYGYIDPSFFGLSEAVLVLTMVALGGAGERRGAVVGACVTIILSFSVSWLPVPAAAAGSLRQLFLAATILVIVRLRPKGLAGSSRQVNP